MVGQSTSADRAEPTDASVMGTEVEREVGLDPDLLRIVEQVVGLRMSEQGLLDGLSDTDRARVLDAVARLLAPPEAAESAPAAAGSDSGSAIEFAKAPEPTDPTEPRMAVEDRAAASDADPPSERSSTDAVPCAGWLVWDTNEDRMLSGADRYWRHFVIWIDDGDGVVEGEEMQDSFELGLRKLDLDLRSYEGANDSTGVVERREIDGIERLRVELLRGRADYGVLAVDLDGMVRGQAPRLRLRSVDGQSTRELGEGFVPIQEGLEVEQKFGNQTRWRPLLCTR